MSDAVTRQKRLLGLLAVIMLTVLAYAPVATFGFVNQDDPTYILVNPHVQQGLNLSAIAWSFTTLYFSNWHPLTWISYLVDLQIFGIDPGAMHMVNLVFHTVNTALVAWLLFRMTGEFWPALFVAAAFALHPLHVESVAWISERKDVLSTLCWLLAMLAYTRYTERGRPLDYAWAMLAFAAGLMAKPMVVTLPFVLLLCDYWPLRRRVSWRRLVVEKVPFFALATASAVVTVVAQHRGGAVSSLDTLGFGYRLANAIAAYGTYLWKTVWPVSLSAFYPHPGMNIAVWKVAIAAVVLAAIAAWAYTARTRKPYLLLGGLWFLGTLVPVIGLLQVGSQAMADRYSYIPLIGIFIALAWLGRDIARARPYLSRVVTALALAFVVAMAGLTARQVWIWQDSISLFRHALAVTPRNSAVHTNLGVALAEAGRFDEAIPHFQAVLEMQPDSARTYYNLARAHEALGDTAAAEPLYRQCLERDPRYADAANNLGMLRMHRGDRDSARAQFEQALRAQPQHLMAHVNLGDLFRMESNWDAAGQEYESALRVFPEFSLALCRLASVRLEQGRKDEARALIDECLRLNRDLEEAQRLRVRLEE